MNKMKFYLVLFLIAFPIMLMTAPVSTGAEGEHTEFIKNDNGYYRVRIEASQWEFKVFDMNAANESGVDLNVNSDAKDSFEVKHRVTMPTAKKGDTIEWFLYSRDVQHGFSINELNLAVALNRPSGGEEFGRPSILETELTASELADDVEGEPGDGVTYSAFCHIFCGLGHPDMKVKFVLGGGAIEYGPIVFGAAIFINVTIFALTLRNIVGKIKLVPDEAPEETPA